MHYDLLVPFLGCIIIFFGNFYMGKHETFLICDSLFSIHENMDYIKINENMDLNINISCQFCPIIFS